MQKGPRDLECSLKHVPGTGHVPGHTRFTFCGTAFHDSDSRVRIADADRLPESTAFQPSECRYSNGCGHPTRVTNSPYSVVPSLHLAGLAKSAATAGTCPQPSGLAPALLETALSIVRPVRALFSSKWKACLRRPAIDWLFRYRLVPRLVHSRGRTGSSL